VSLPEPSAKREPREKKRPVPRKVRSAIAFLNNGTVKTITEAAEKAGITREYFSRSMSLPHVVAYMNTISARTMALATGRASAVKVDLLDCDSSHVRNDASTFVLGVAGIKPVVDPNISLQVGLEIKAGYVIDLTEPGDVDRRMIDVTPANSPSQRTTP
jgi:hypothetical protein